MIKRLIQRLKKKRESKSVSPCTITETSFGGRNPLTVSSIRSKQASQRYKTSNMMAQSRKGRLSTECRLQRKTEFFYLSENSYEKEKILTTNFKTRPYNFKNSLLSTCRCYQTRMWRRHSVAKKSPWSYQKLLISCPMMKK